MKNETAFRVESLPFIPSGEYVGEFNCKGELLRHINLNERREQLQEKEHEQPKQYINKNQLQLF